MPEAEAHSGAYTCVFIPADTSAPLEERAIPFSSAEHEVRSMLDHAKRHYARRRPPLTPQQREQHKRSLMAQVPEDSRSKITDDMVAAAADMSSVESVALLNHSAEHGFVGVNLYCDDKAGMGGQAVENVRASEICRLCGKVLQVNGDAFLGRVFDNEDGFKRLDFGLADVDSDAAWIKAAEQQSKKRRTKESSEAFVADMSNRVGSQKAATAPASQQKPGPVAVPQAAEEAKEAGNAAFKAGKLDEALAAYSKALELCPDFAAARSNRALIHLRQHRYREAEEDCSRLLAGPAIASEPANVKALLRRAAAREAQQKARGALEDFRLACRMEPNNREAREGYQRVGAALKAQAAQPEAKPEERKAEGA